MFVCTIKGQQFSILVSLFRLMADYVSQGKKFAIITRKGRRREALRGGGNIWNSPPEETCE